MRHFLLSGLAVIFLSSCGAPDKSVEGVVSVKNYSWSMVTTWPKNYPGLGMAPERFSQLVEEMSQGQLKVTQVSRRRCFCEKLFLVDGDHLAKKLPRLGHGP